MKIRKILKYTWFPILVLLAAAWFISPVTFMKGVKPEEVAYITIFDGNTGDESDFDDQADIACILENLQSTPVKRDGISVLEMGYRFRMTFVGINGEELGQVIINSADTIRGDFFFYTAKEGGLCFDYLWNLMDEVHDYI